MGGGSESGSSSGEEGGYSEWKSTIDSIAAATASSFASSSAAKPPLSSPAGDDDFDYDYKPKTQPLKHYQTKARKMLDDILERTLEFVKIPFSIPETDSMNEEVGIRLFKNSPPGIVFDQINELQQPRKRPRLLPGKELDEKSKKFRRRIKSTVVDGEDIMAAAREACKKSVAKFEARDGAAKAAALREEERVAELKRIRGERWLPSIAREMQLKL